MLRPDPARVGWLVLLLCGGCGLDDVGALADAGPRVELGARWLRADTTRVALCRSDPVEGTCARIYFEGAGPGFPEGWRPSVGHLGRIGPCRAGAIEPRASSLVEADGRVDGFDELGTLQVDLTAAFSGGRRVRFEGAVVMGEGPCP